MSRIHALILDYHGSSDTSRCVDALLAVSTADAVTVNVLINGSGTAHRDHLHACYDGNDRVSLHDSPVNLGFADGMNHLHELLQPLIREGDYLLLLNNDAEVQASTLDILRGVLDTDPVVAIATPRVLDAAQPDRILEDGLEFHPWLMQHRPRHQGRAADYPPRCRPRIQPVTHATCMLIRADVFRKSGGFDPVFFAYFEDWDLCFRVRAAGYRIVHVDTATIRHAGSAATGTCSRPYQFLMTRNRLLLARRWLPGIVFFTLFLPWFLLVKVLGKSLQLVLGGHGEGLAGVWQALAWCCAGAERRSRYWPFRDEGSNGV